MAKRYGWLLLILLAAASLRLAFLSDVPPGLTHDEADHGLDAWGVLNGVRPIYFTVGYGREPLYDYATAGLMTFLGPTYLAGRLISAYISLILIAGTYAWAHRAFNRRIALLTAAGLAVSFWAVMTGRQALRSITLPALFVLSAYFFWQALDVAGARDWRVGLGSGITIPDNQHPRPNPKSPILSFLVAGILLGITFYAYIPARMMWVIFPLLLLYLAFVNRALFAKAWRGTALMLIVAAAIALPLLAYLATNPSAETRLEQLSDPLTAAGEGDFEPLLDNVIEGLRLLSIEGDSQWRYNISGRPFLPPLVSVLFIVGLGLALWWLVAGWRDKGQSRRSAAAFFALSWLVLGLSPTFITGSELSTTQAIGALPILFVFPAIAIAPLLDARRFGEKLATVSTVLIVLLFTALFAQTAKAYFVTWANEPEVRVQYETTLVSAVDYLNEYGRGPASISTTTPNRFHSPAVASMTLDNPAVQIRWFDGQNSLLLPQEETSTVIFTGFAL